MHIYKLNGCNSCDCDFPHRPTTVHRFYIKHTVEERIHELLTSHADKTKFLMRLVLTFKDAVAINSYLKMFMHVCYVV